MSKTIPTKFFDVIMGVRNKNDLSGKWESKTVRVETKLDDLAAFAASLKLKEDYPSEDGWELDFVSAEVIPL